MTYKKLLPSHLAFKNWINIILRTDHKFKISLQHTNFFFQFQLQRSAETNQTNRQQPPQQYRNTNTSNTNNTVPRNVYTIDVSRNYSSQQQQQPFGTTPVLNPNTQNDQPWRHPYAIPNYKPNAPPSHTEPEEDLLPPKYDDIFPDWKWKHIYYFVLKI